MEKKQLNKLLNKLTKLLYEMDMADALAKLEKTANLDIGQLQELEEAYYEQYEQKDW